MACLQKMRIPTNSMSPTLVKGSLITVDMIYDARKSPNRWDIIVMGAPQVEGLGQKLGRVPLKAAANANKSAGKASESEQPLAKAFTGVVNAAAGAFQKGKVQVRPHMFFVNRVVGLPGERIQFTGSKILINGRPVRVPGELVKAYSSFGHAKNLAYGAQEYVVPANSVFVLNDNPRGSTDSRQMGAVSVDFIVGRVVT